MTRISATPSNEQSIHAALELSKKRWLLAIQVPGRWSSPIELVHR